MVSPSMGKKHSESIHFKPCKRGLQVGVSVYPLLRVLSLPISPKTHKKQEACWKVSGSWRNKEVFIPVPANRVSPGFYSHICGSETLRQVSTDY